jgi:hypothetical protein
MPSADATRSTPTSSSFNWSVAAATSTQPTPSPRCCVRSSRTTATPRSRRSRTSGRAPDTAAIIALGCNEIVLHKGAEFGDFSAFTDPPGELPRRIETLRQFAQEQNYPPLLVQGFLDRDLTLHYAKSIRGGAEWRLLSNADLEKDRAAKEPRWEVHARQVPGQFLVLNAETARTSVSVPRRDGIPQMYEAPSQGVAGDAGRQ